MKFDTQDIVIACCIICVVGIIAAALVISNYNDNQIATKMAELNYEQQLVNGNKIWTKRVADKAEK